jgi:hypothetical protein
VTSIVREDDENSFTTSTSAFKSLTRGSPKFGSASKQHQTAFSHSWSKANCAPSSQSTYAYHPSLKLVCNMKAPNELHRTRTYRVLLVLVSCSKTVLVDDRHIHTATGIHAGGKPAVGQQQLHPWLTAAGQWARFYGSKYSLVLLIALFYVLSSGILSVTCWICLMVTSK